MATKEDPGILRLVVVFLRFFADQTQAEFAKACVSVSGRYLALEAGLQTPRGEKPAGDVGRGRRAVGRGWAPGRFYGAVLTAVPNGSGARPGEDRLERPDDGRCLVSGAFFLKSLPIWKKPHW